MMSEERAFEQDMKTIQKHAMAIHALIAPGMTVEISWPEQGGIIVPGQPPKVSRLMITRPHLFVGVRATHRDAHNNGR